MHGKVERGGDGFPALLVQLVAIKLIAIAQRIVAIRVRVLFKVICRVDQVDPAAEVVENFLHHAPPHLVINTVGDVRHQRGERLGGLIERGAVLLLALVQII